METEIELKYLVDANDVSDEICQLLELKKINYEKKTKSLINSYFDTDTMALRKLDMGLRVRTYPDYREQTIKTAGIVIGGLHQRPEYNVTIDAGQPDLSLFPSSIWPDNYDVSSLQSDILPIFSTNFERVTWQINHPDGIIELAYDKGQIESSNESIPINEIELELLSGDIKALFDIALLLFESLTLRPGLKSKAARGYSLWKAPIVKSEQEEPDKVIAPPQAMLAPLNPSLTAFDGFYVGVTYGLEQIQHNIALYLEHKHFSYLASIRRAMKMISHGLDSFSDIIENENIPSLKQQIAHLNSSLAWVDKAQHVKDLTRKSGKYRKKLEYSGQLIELLRLKRGNFPAEEVVIKQLQGVEFNKLQLDLLVLIIDRNEPKAQINVKQFAYNILEQSLRELVSAIPESVSMSATQYLSLKPYLTNSLLAGVWFGGLYDEELRKDYRSPWLDILQGIDELAIFKLLQNQLQQLEDQPDKLIRWLDSKIEHLVEAIEYSRNSAVSVEPYWREML